MLVLNLGQVSSEKDDTLKKATTENQAKVFMDGPDLGSSHLEAAQYPVNRRRIIVCLSSNCSMPLRESQHLQLLFTHMSL